MNATRLWTFGSIVVILAVIAGTWFLGISPRLDEASAANSDRTTVEAQNLIHEATIAALKVQAEKLDELKADLATLHRAVPAQADLSLLIGQINSFATNTGVTITQLTSADPIGFAPMADASVEGAQVDPELMAALSSVSAENFLVIPIGINLTGEYGAVMEFVNQLQHGERLVLVHALSLTKGPALPGTVVEFSLTGQTFVFLDTVAPVVADVAESTETAAAN